MILRNSSLLVAILFALSISSVLGLPTTSDRKRSKQLNEGSPSVAKIFEVDQNNRILRQWTKINENGETVLEKLDRIRLECTSDLHPVQWLYFGHGAPQLTSNITFSRIKARSGESSLEYVATALISPTKEHHTGKYICSSTEAYDTRTFFYIYVPGPTLFSALNGQDLYIPKNDSNILIPCTVSNPDVIVTLEKSINEVLQRVKPSLVRYDPKQGFRLDIRGLDDPEGIYVCTARYNNLVRGIEYTLRYPTRPSRDEPVKITTASEAAGAACGTKCGDNAHCEVVNGQEACQCNPHFKGNPKEECVRDCHSHSDCPSNTVCFRDLKCRDPCVHSIRCGSQALCRVENAYPVCYCPENFVGDPKTGCFNSIQNDAPPSRLNFTKSAAQCKKNCGDGGYCVLENGKEVCNCRRGTNGDPQDGCEIRCQSHDECPDDLSCNTLLKCHSPCVHNIRCGVGASCSVIEHRPKCFCPRDSVGDPMKECTSGYQGDQPASSTSTPEPAGLPPTSPNPKDKCSRDEQCASHEKCMKPGVNRGKECLDPCVTRRCGIQAECRTESHYTFCICKNGFEGNANKECVPLRFGVEPLLREQTRPPTATTTVQQPNCSKPEECGPFSKCTLDKDGRQSCECLEGHVGSPPQCSQECKINSDCGRSQVCLEDTRLTFPYCAKVCGGKICGANAVCREATGVIPADCECPIGFGGDAYLHCKNLNDKIGQDCTMDSECGSTLRCETGADYRKCVDPCETEKCSENLECAVQDHHATCICPAGYTGNPSIGCTLDAEFNITAINSNPCRGLICGEHSECRMDNNGRPTCACRSYAVGEPPSCYQECKSNSECDLGLSCVQKRCRHSCSRCGINTKCLISRNPNQESICSCLDGFEGDPKLGCRPIRA